MIEQKYLLNKNSRFRKVFSRLIAQKGKQPTETRNVIAFVLKIISNMILLLNEAKINNIFFGK